MEKDTHTRKPLNLAEREPEFQLDLRRLKEPSNVFQHMVKIRRMYPFLNLEMTITGPKDSSWAMYIWSSTSVNTVGSMKKPK